MCQKKALIPAPEACTWALPLPEQLKQHTESVCPGNINASAPHPGKYIVDDPEDRGLVHPATAHHGGRIHTTQLSDSKAAALGGGCVFLRHEGERKRKILGTQEDT